MRIYFNMSVLQTWSELKAIIKSPSGLNTTKFKIKALFLVVVWSWQSGISVGRQ